jgi:anti-sigma factor RsiW
MAHLSDEDRENLVAYLDGELDDESARTLEAKLNLDPNARAETEAMQQAWGLLDYLPRAEPSASFTHRTLERLALQTGPAHAPQRWLGGLAWAAAVLIAAAAGFMGARWIPHAREASDLDEQIVRHLRVIEKVQLYDQVEDIDFLRALDQPDLFADEPGS